MLREGYLCVRTPCVCSFSNVAGISLNSVRALAASALPPARHASPFGVITDSTRLLDGPTL